jgi:hypothetical protein
MRHVNVYDQLNDLVTRLAAADGTVAAERAPDIPATDLSHEGLAAIVGGRRPASLGGFGLKIGGAEAAGFFKKRPGLTRSQRCMGRKRTR